MTRPKRNLGEKVFAQLELEIRNGELRPGARLDEQSIAQRFGVSRTPARDALRQLAAAGLIRMVPRQGAVVRVPSAREYVAMTEILTELEALAARLATRRMTEPEREALALAHQEGERAVTRHSRTEYAIANTHFHDILYAGSRNDMLVEQIRGLRSRMGGIRSNTFDHPGRIAMSCAEHAAVLRAVLAGDEEAAQRAMRLHISVGGTVYADLIASLDAASPAGQEAGG